MRNSGLWQAWSCTKWGVRFGGSTKSTKSGSRVKRIALVSALRKAGWICGQEKAVNCLLPLLNQDEAANFTVSASPPPPPSPKPHPPRLCRLLCSAKHIHVHLLCVHPLSRPFGSEAATKFGYIDGEPM